MYFITVTEDFNFFENEYKDSRCWGYYNDLKTAKDVISRDSSMEETIYDYLVIEKVEEGIYPTIKEVAWYEWSEEKWVEINKPEQFYRVCNWALS